VWSLTLLPSSQQSDSVPAISFALNIQESEMIPILSGSEEIENSYSFQSDDSLPALIAWASVWVTYGRYFKDLLIDLPSIST